MASRRKLKLSTEDSEIIENMFAKVGKIGCFFQEAGRRPAPGTTSEQAASQSNDAP